ncbi:Serine/threonine-protein kinase MRCK beta [Streptococcus suis]|nr:Serine/threonine-protein kinase MRCK beta [Streptococcus suis]CYU45792.1 Serine/threonine-protein kinase MRCK beta [Streptococcus suis]CYV19329.1 Serine/threonine-protein kinase MRCK beta [Streptococcus suis]CYW24626.1 Serine/threonine-protein kinase MRCK beta [Streptococcus suis]
MHQITCPHCGTAFQVNETEYSQLLAQVRGAEFDKKSTTVWSGNGNY